jgi:hypothetical protein
MSITVRAAFPLLESSFRFEQLSVPTILMGIGEARA